MNLRDRTDFSSPSTPSTLSVLVARPACRWGLTLALLASLGACQKATELATEKAAEKILEAQINKDGTNAKVDLGSGGLSVQGTDEQGKAFKMEMGSAQVNEKEMGIPFYPGAKPLENTGTRMINGELSMWQLELTSSDAPKKVAAWYREQMKPLAEGKMVMEQSRDDGMMLNISDAKTEGSMMIDITVAEGGSTISLMRSQKGAPAQ